jgi:hypothetical protein
VKIEFPQENSPPSCTVFTQVSHDATAAFVAATSGELCLARAAK